MSDFDRERTDASDIRPVVNRRDFIRGGVVGAASISFAALLARRAGASELPYSDDYGPVAPVNDLTTGLPLIALPAGFSYRSYGWTGQLMDDMQMTPSLHDGMDVVSSKGTHVFLMRNHEQGTGGVAFNAPAAYDAAFAYGGTTLLQFDTQSGIWQMARATLTGTVRNCAGGKTPWSSWLTCEEATNVSPGGVRHGWIFEVPAFGAATGQPLYAMGRSEWEACSVDPATGYVYQTEDATPGGFYKFVPNQYGKLHLGGTLYALKVRGQDNFNFSGLGSPRVYVSFPVGTTWDVEWVQVTDVEALSGRLYNSAPGRACFSRPEGTFYDSGKIYFTCTDGGAAHQGQVFCYDPRRETITIVFDSTGPGLSNTEANNPDNIAVSPRGGIVICEDGGNSIQRLRGITQSGGSFVFAENRINLSAANIAQIDQSADKGRGNVSSLLRVRSYTNQEWAGACFFGKWMFVNIQTPGVTFAITGPWDNGAL